MVSTDTIDYHLLFDLPFFPLNDSSSDYNLQALLNSNQSPENPVDQLTCQNQLLSSPPTDQLGNLSLHQTTQFQSFLSFGPNLEQGSESFGHLNGLEAKNEECQVGSDSAYSDGENVAKYLQRSFSSNSFERKPGFLFQPPFDPLMESENFQGQALCMPENSFFTGQLRKNRSRRSILDPSDLENSFMLEAQAPFKVGRYNPEERQERISKYRAKRNRRNFHKTIKYACRKKVADNRPRIRGRFARNDEVVEIPKAACSTRDEIEDVLSVEDDETMARGDFMNSFSQNQFQWHHGCF